MKFLRQGLLIQLVLCRLIQALASISGHLDEALLPLNPSEIASTFVVLKDLHFNTLAVTSITSHGKFTFHNISEGGYLVSLDSVALTTGGYYRIDVTAADAGLSIGVHQVVIGHDVVNDLGPQVAYPVPIAAKRQKFLEERSKFSLLSVLKSPMILMSLVSLIMVFAVPKLMENMDPETLQQMQDHQAKRSEAMDKVSNFDVASFIAEKTTKKN